MNPSTRFIQDCDNRICLAIDLREDTNKVIIAAAFVHPNDQYRKRTGAGICTTRIKSYLTNPEERLPYYTMEVPAQVFADEEGVLRPYQTISKIYKQTLAKQQTLFGMEMDRELFWTDFVEKVCAHSTDVLLSTAN